MLEPRASRFYQAALQSGLIDEAGLDACWAQVPDEKRTPDAADRRLARQAITTGKLTLWQAQQLIAGRSTGYKIDKYILLDLIGRGGMGRVYLAKDVRLNRRVALKILSQERMTNPRALARFEREAKVGAQLQHEHLVRIYDEGESGGVRYLVMEYIEGKNVGQLIGELGAIPWPTAARLARQVALGLDHARLKELIHRDVNPCNILVTVDGTAKLTDLGLAIDLNEQDQVTRDGATVGTFDYVAPEQARHSRSVDTRADIYSLGCTIYHMIAGRVPFPVASLPEKLYAHQLHDPDPLTEVTPGVPEGLAEVVRRMMRKRTEERYQTPAEVAQALEPFAIEAGWSATGGGDAAVLGLAVGSKSKEATTSASAGAGAPARPAVETQGATPGPAKAAEDPAAWAARLAQGAGAGNGAGAAASASSSAPGPETSGLAPTPVVATNVVVGDSIFPLDFGPDDPLGGLGLGSGSKSPFTRGPAWTDDRRRKALLVATAAVAAAVATALVVVLAALSISGPGGSSGRVKKTIIGEIKAPPPLAKGAIVVRHSDGTSEPARDLSEAIARAVRAREEILLADGSTARVSTDKLIRVHSGGVTIRPVDGGRATLEVQIKKTMPNQPATQMFVVDADLRLSGLEVVVNFEGPSNVPVFQTEGGLILDRCAFRATGETEGSTLALAEGKQVSAVGCLFEGFDCPIEIAARPGLSATLDRSIFLSAAGGDEATGRAVRVRSVFGGAGAGFLLKVDRCSTRAGSFLEAANFGVEGPLIVEVSHSAFLVKALLTTDEKGVLGPDQAIRWKGDDNRFQVTPAIDKGTWATLTGLQTLPDGPVDLASWSKVAAEATTSKVEPMRWAESALVGDDGKPVGADPAQVGPLAKPVASSQ